MDLVEHYLRAVAALLPKDQREDIVAELRDSLLMMIEEREDRVGRPLTPDEVEAVLRELGHPLVVAARYREGPQHAVGPSLYPYWMFAVKAAIAIQAVAAVVTVLARTLRGQDFGHALGQAIAQGLIGAATMVGFATVAGWLIERQKVHVTYLDRWRVKDLRALEFVGWDFADLKSWFAQRQAAAPGARVQWDRGPTPVAARAFSAIVLGSVFVLWWTGALNFGLVGSITDLYQLGLDPGPLEAVDWAQLRQALFWPLLAYGLAIITQGIIVLVYPRSAAARGATDLMLGAALVGFCAWFWFASPLASAVQVESVSELIVGVKAAFNNSPPMALAPLLALGLAATAFGGLCRMLQGLWVLFAGSGPQQTAVGSPTAG